MASPHTVDPVEGALARDAHDAAAIPSPPTDLRGVVFSLISPLYVTFYNANEARVSHDSMLAQASEAATKQGKCALVTPQGFTLITPPGGGNPGIQGDGARVYELILPVLGEPACKALGGHYPHPTLPALHAMVQEVEAQLQEEARKDGYALPPHALKRRAHAAVGVWALEQEMRDNHPRRLTDSQWRRLVANRHSRVSGTAPHKHKPTSGDFRGLWEQLCPGKRVHKKDSYYPYIRPAQPEGHVATFDCAALLQALEQHDGPLADDDPQMWGILDRLWVHDPSFSQQLALDIEKAAAEEQRALVLPPADKPHVPCSMDEQFEATTLPKWEGKGVIRKTPSEVALAPGNVVCPVKIQPKGDLLLSPEQQRMVEARDLKGLGMEADTLSTAMTEEVWSRVQAGEKPEDAADAVYASRLGPKALRMCHSARALNQYLDHGSFSFPGPPEMLWGTDEESEVYCIDLVAFYFSFLLGKESSYAMFLKYKDQYYQQMRMSMGMSDSALVSSLASALIVYLARRRGVTNVYSYIDDLGGSAHRSVAKQHLAILIECAELVLPRGVSHEKTRPPLPVQQYLGLTYDFPGNKLAPTALKIFHYAVHAMFVRKCLAFEHPKRDRVNDTPHPMWQAVSTPSLLKVTGKLGYMADTVTLGKVHMRGLYAHLANQCAPGYFLRSRILEDLDWWCSQFKAGALDGVTIMRGPTPITLHAKGGGACKDAVGGPKVGVLRSDAGAPGGGAVHEGHAIYRQWTAKERGFHSDLREALMLLTGVKQYDHKWQGARVVYVLDHAGDTHSINRGNADSNLMRQVIDELYARAHAGGYTFVAVWGPRESNTWCDALSKQTNKEAAAQVAKELGLTLD